MQPSAHRRSRRPQVLRNPGSLHRARVGAPNAMRSFTQNSPPATGGSPEAGARPPVLLVIGDLREDGRLGADRLPAAKRPAHAQATWARCAALMTASLDAPVARAPEVCSAPPRSSQRTPSSSVSARLVMIGCPFCRVTPPPWLAGGEPKETRSPPPGSAGSCRLGDLLVGRADIDDRRGLRAGSKRERGRRHLSSMGVSTSGDQADQLASIGEQPARGSLT